MVYGNELVNPCLGAEFQRAEEPSDELNADFDAAIALRVVSGRVLLRDRSQAAPVSETEPRDVPWVHARRLLLSFLAATNH